MQSEFSYRLLFEPGKKYACKIVSVKKHSCQIKVEGVPAQLLGLARNFVFPNRVSFSESIGWKGECEIELNPQGSGLLATKIKLKENEMNEIKKENIMEKKPSYEELEQIAEEAKEYFVFFTDNPIETIVVDLDGKVIKYNKAVEEAVGKGRRSRLPEIGDKMYIDYGSRHEIDMRKELMACISEKKTKKFTGMSYDDSFINIRIVSIGKGAIILLTDVTEQKQAEKEKLQAQKITIEHEKMALVGQIAGETAHDFNNILGVILGNIELILMNCEKQKTKERLELIFEQILRGRSLTKNLVTFAKNQKPKQEFFSIVEKIDLIINLLGKDLEGISVTKEDGAKIPRLFADPGMIEHVLVNLIQNSIHALSKVEYPIIKIKTYVLDSAICFKIEDNGCGIPKEYQESIFEPTFTLKGARDTTGSYKKGIRGTGYGMVNIKKYIAQHKGKILVDSEVGVGTVFTICLPIIEKDLTKEEKVEIQEEIIYFEKSILLVEDEPSLSDIQYRILSGAPYKHRVDKADNGQVAMDLFDRNKYDCISLDYFLPGENNGMDVYNHIRKTDKAIPILFISGNIEFLKSIEELKQTDVYIDYLSKPCRNRDYVNGINKLLEKNLIR